MQPQSLLLLPRLYLALIFLVAATTKLQMHGAFTPTLAGFLHGIALQNGFSWYKPIVTQIILPHLSQIGQFVVAGELYVGFALFAGIATRVAAIVAIVLLFNYASAKGAVPWSPASNDWADIVLALIVAIGGAGPSFAFDAWLMRKPHVRYS
jgi:uncharacterized membrane protein YphA (DoxX/SURF4 family)